ncbi:MAG: hypothetical protein M1457_11895, partial [bacterium]|nr:hypothetical protein [bacterium]
IRCAGWLFQRHRPAACAVACAAGTAVRADFALAALLWAALWLRRSRRDFYIYALAGGAMAMAWLGWLIHAFGSALPNTLEVKRLQGHWLATGDPRAFSGWLTLGAGLRWLLRRTLFEPPAGAVALVGLGLLTARPRLWIVPAWAVLHVGAYRLLGVPGHYGWYFYPLWLLISLGAGIGVAAVGAIFRNVPPDAANSAAPAPPGGRWREFATVSALAVFCAMNLYGQADTRWARDKSRAYAGMAQLLRRQVAPGQSVLMNEIGQMGYLSDVRVVDTHGLIHTLRDPDALGRLPQLVDRFRPDYIVLEGWLAGAPPDYGPRVRAGDYELSFILPGGRRARYRESGHVDVPPDHLPVLLKREPDAPPPPAHRPDGAKPPSR